MNPRGGTELQYEFLERHVDRKLLDQVQICTSIPGKVPLHAGKVNILWQKNSFDQPNIYPWFQDKSNHSKYDWYVFNSHWNLENFRKHFDLPGEKCVIIKNGVVPITPNKPYKKGDPIKLIFHPTPWRGLNIILAAMQLVKNPLVSLDVYSSTEVYGDAFKQANDSAYVGLYEQAKQLPNVNYIGYKPNEYILENLKNYHIFAYPSIWEETFCISALEAMAAGLYVITTNYGALYETCAEFSAYIIYEKSFESLAKKFAFAIDHTANNLHQEALRNHIEFQIEYVNRNYNWNKQGNMWSTFLKGAVNARRK